MKTGRTELKLFRVRHNLTQEQTAARIGCGRMTYAAVENGKRKPSARFREDFQKAFNISDKNFVELMKIDTDRQKENDR